MAQSFDGDAALGGISAAASIWRDLAASPGDIAFDGVKFLKQHMG